MKESAIRLQCFILARVGKGKTKVDIALDPLEGTSITAKGENALSVLAIGEGSFLHAPDIYMKKLLTDISEELEINIDDSPEKIISDFLTFLKLDKKILW